MQPLSAAQPLHMVQHLRFYSSAAVSSAAGGPGEAAVGAEADGTGQDEAWAESDLVESPSEPEYPRSAPGKHSFVL